MGKRLRKDCDEHGNQTEKWVRGPSTLAKVFEQPQVDNNKKDFTLGKISAVEFRNKKSKWKSSSYTPYDTYEERLTKKPEQLSQSEWIALIRHWDTPEQQAIAERNRKNRAKQIAKHTSGRISFPQLREKMVNKCFCLI
ncbi:hypothetical protein ACHQM5_015976 [Ranunculus cassubicifolius]